MKPLLVIHDIREYVTLEQAGILMQSAHEMGYRAGLKAAQIETTQIEADTVRIIEEVAE